jgi:hypothetical protein
MSFERHLAESMYIKKGAGIPAPPYAIGSDYSSLSCSPAELNSASPDEPNLQNLIAQFNLHSPAPLNYKYNYPPF